MPELRLRPHGTWSPMERFQVKKGDNSWPSAMQSCPPPAVPWPDRKICAVRLIFKKFLKSRPAGLNAGGRLVPQDSPLPTFLPRFSPRAPPATWVALARQYTYQCGWVQLRIPHPSGTYGQGATTAALPFGVFAKETISGDET